jgi:hypothetical protein
MVMDYEKSIILMIPFVIQIIQLRFITDEGYMKPKDIIIPVMLLKVSAGRSTIQQSTGLPTGTYFYILSYTSLDGTGKL